MTEANKSKWYENRRNELLGLLGEATALDISQKYADELRETARKCQEDAFEIALVGEFAGGKSTTFDALCGGRDISPRGGGGIKTSAAVISAQNIAGDETKDGLAEWAEVTFKTKESIALGLSTILRPEVAESKAFRALNRGLSDQEFKLAIATDEGFPSVADLEKPQCVKLLRKAADRLWKEWEKDKANALTSEELDQLRIATLQLRYFGTDGHRDLQRRTTMPIDRFQELVAFPKDWETRWCEGRNAEFELSEVAFVFVHSVLVHLRSDNLRKLGCRITDCPGLFANAFDTSVAEKAIRRADAVWYLIGGEKMLGETDRMCLRQIAAWGLAGRIQATVNIRTDWDHKSTEILDATKSILSNMGLGFEVIPYNARLAFLAAQGKLLLETPERFGELDRANMARDAKAKGEPRDPAAMWTKMVRRIGTSMEVEKLEDIENLDSPSVGTALEASHFDAILARLENDVIPKKAESILVNRGSKRAVDALVAYEGVLRATEEAAEAEESKWRAALEEARRQLETFIEGARRIIDHSPLGCDLDMTAKGLSDEILNFALDEEYVTALSLRIAEKFLDKATTPAMVLSKEKLVQALGKELPAVFAEESRNAMSRALVQWPEITRRQRLQQRTERICENIHELWVEREIDAMEMLKGFETPSVSEEDINDLCANLSSELFGRQQLLKSLMAARNLWMEMLRVFFERLLVWVVDFLWRQIDPTTFFLHEQDKEFRRQKRMGGIAKKIQKPIENAVNDVSFRKGIGQVLEKQLSTSLGGLSDKLRKRLDDLKADFEKERVEGPEKMFGQTKAERKRIAAENKAVRTGTIAPLRKRIEAFQAEVMAALGT